MIRIVDPCAPIATRSEKLLRDYYDREFRKFVSERISAKHLKSYDRAIILFLLFAGELIRVADVTDELLAAFTAAGKTSGRGKHQRARLAGLVRQIVLAAKPNIVRKPRQRVDVLPPAKRGTVRHYFETVYVAEAMVDVEDQSVESIRTTFRALREFVGHDIELNEQSDKLAADFLRHLCKLGFVQATVNRYRRTWFAVWRHAFDRDLVKRLPRVKRLKEIRNPPDAWSVDEMRALTEAALQYRRIDLYGDAVRCNLWWHAVLLTAYYTGLRRGSLLSIRRSDFDRKSGMLFVDGENMKNRHGQMFQLGQEAIAAIEQIWMPPRMLLFPSHHTHGTISKHFGELLVAAGIPPSRRRGLSKFHKIRRSVATEIAARAGQGAASSLLGHSSSYVTARYIDPSKLPGHDVTKILPSLVAG